MLYVKNVHARPHRVGRLLWRPNQTHPINDHWLNKSVMRALVSKGWFIVSDQPFTQAKAAVNQEPGKVDNKMEKVPESQVVAQETASEPAVMDAHGPVNVAALGQIDLELDPVPIREEQEEEKPEEASTGDPSPQEAVVETVDAETHTAESLHEMAFKDLRELGQSFGVSARAKQDLIDRILEAQESNGS